MIFTVMVARRIACHCRRRHSLNTDRARPNSLVRDLDRIYTEKRENGTENSSNE